MFDTFLHSSHFTTAFALLFFLHIHTNTVAMGLRNAQEVRQYTQTLTPAEKVLLQEWISKHFYDAIIHAATKNDLDAVTFSLENGANIDATLTPRNDTALHLVTRKYNNYGLAELLVQAGANPNMQDGIGWTPLHNAADLCTHTMVKLLLQAGANPNARDADNRTPLYLAVARSQTWAKCLKETDVIDNADDCDQQDLTVALLLAAGADEYAKTNDSFSALDQAKLFTNKTILEMFQNNSLIETMYQNNKKNIIYLGTDCSICHEGQGLCNQDNAYVDILMLSCNHCFHRSCISLWFLKDRTCPVCRTAIDLAIT